MKVGRVIGIDDGYFERGRDERAPLVATIMKGSVIEGFRFGWAAVDGSDATKRIIDLVRVYKEQVSAVFLYGTIFAGTNVVSLEDVFYSLEKPVIAVADERPDDRLVTASLRRYGREESLRVYHANPPMRELKTKRGVLYVSYLGASEGDVLRIVEHYQLVGKIPEPLRISHLIGREVGRWV